MTMCYSPADLRYVKLQSEAYLSGYAALVATHPGNGVEAPPAPVEEIPDMAEAERVWKLLCQSAQGG